MTSRNTQRMTSRNTVPPGAAQAPIIDASMADAYIARAHVAPAHVTRAGTRLEKQRS